MKRAATLGIIGAIVLAAGCGGDDTADPADVTEPAATTEPTTPGPSAATIAPTTVAPPTTAAVPATTAPPTVAPTIAPATTSPTTAAEFVPAASIDLDDPALGLEPENTSYTATLLFTMERDLGDGQVERALIEGAGGRVYDDSTDPPTDVHNFVVATEGPVDLPPGCLDFGAMDPTFQDVYVTFSGFATTDDNDLTGEAFLVEEGIELNGVVVDRYEVTLDNVEPASADEYVTFDQAFVDIARDAGQVAAVVLNGTGYNNSFLIDQSEPRRITYELFFFDFGTTDELIRPFNCPAA